MRFKIFGMVVLIFAQGLFIADSAQAQSVIGWTLVGGAGNAADDTGFGGVAADFEISRFEISNAQYAAFLNAVADTDTFSVYSVFMGTGSNGGGIIRSGTSGNYSYTAEAGRENHPVNYVSWFDAVRFVNWLHNSMKAGPQDSSTTEDGAYLLTGISTVGPRKPGARYSLPTTDEWYKAAYYEVDTTSYFEYPAGSEAVSTCSAPTNAVNSANCAGAVGDLVAAGSYPNSIGPNGTFDQGGNVREWIEDITVGSTNRIGRGGDYQLAVNFLSAADRVLLNGTGESSAIGFRVVRLIPPVPALGPLGLGVLSGLLTTAGCHASRRRANQKSPFVGSARVRRP